jgi:hypothetical protein
VSSYVHLTSHIAPDIPITEARDNNDTNTTGSSDAHIDNASDESPKGESPDLLCFGITLDSFYSDTYLLFYLIFEVIDKGGTKDDYVSKKGSGDDGAVDQGSHGNDARVDHLDNGSPKGESRDLFSLGIILDSFSSDTHLFVSYST